MADGVAGALPGVPRFPVGDRRGADGGSSVGDVVFEAVLLDVDDGAHPGSVLGSVRRAWAERLGDVVRRVLHRTVGLLADPIGEDIADRVEFDLVGLVGGEVARSTVSARL